MATLADLDTAIANLQTDVTALIASQPKPVDVSTEVAAVNTIDAQVKAAIAANTPSA